MARLPVASVVYESGSEKAAQSGPCRQRFHIARVSLFRLPTRSGTCGTLIDVCKRERRAASPLRTNDDGIGALYVDAGDRSG
jgi:hypothetical protein